ncbi:MAG: bifunctional folylpolyglutamate synthase/dihydrofolate synthase [Gammaproteobacteria bacterium]|nr:MAG: bifunctional folylpolyglutamate synthase/dihydrofolate synthase [Gammaproteobacteria bacterium]
MPSRLPEWLERISALHPSEIELGLDRMHVVADRLLGKEWLAGKVVTLAGTNGKGSTLAMIERLAIDAGKSVMAYTSPHLLRFTERLRINGAESQESEWAEAFKQVEGARQGTPLTYFEFTTLAALWLIRQARPDLALLEVGLGGRLDAVNIVDPDVAVITPVDLDHTDWLGEDREAIGREKAGILRPGIPLISSDPVVPESVLQAARELECPVWLWDRDHRIESVSGAARWLGSTVSQGGVDLQRTLPGFDQCPLPPENVSAALQVAQLLGLLPQQDQVSPWEALGLSGRVQRIGESPEIIVDVGHNPQAARYLAGWLNRNSCTGRTWAVYSALADKAIEEVVQTLSGSIQDWWIAPVKADRAAPADRLAGAVRQAGHVPVVMASIREALAQVRQQAAPNDRVLVFGSFYTVAEALEALQG